MKTRKLHCKIRQFLAFHSRKRGKICSGNFSGSDILNVLTHCSSPSESSSYRCPIGKIIRLIVHTIAIIGMLVMMVDITLEYLNSPTVTTAETSPYPTQKVDFPAITICSVNRISRKAAYELAEELMDINSMLLTANVTTKTLTQMLRLMGHLYTFKLPDTDVDKLNLLHTILERGYNGYDMEEIMRRLTPKCRSILRKCAWEGKDQVCDDLFYLRRTDTGLCCVFNYIRQTDSFNSSDNDAFITQPALHTKKIGSEYGLSVLLNPQVQDSGYELLPSHGVLIKVHLPYDYPDASSGGLREVLVSPRMETYVDLDAVTFYADPDVEKYDVHKRDCLFSTEQSNLFHGHYSFSDCIMYCRIRDILKLCKCVPFFFPVGVNKVASRTCNLKDLPCVQTYRDKWLQLKPRCERNMVPFSDEMFEGKSGYLTCNCLPSCADTSYKVSASSIPLRLREVLWGRSKHTLTNHSIVHIFFGHSGTIRLRQEVQFYGYELMSLYGGICSFFLGVSVISVIEIFYKVMIALCTSNNESPTTSSNVEAPSGRKRIEVNSIFKTEKSGSSGVTSVLYWDEVTRSVPQKQMDLIDSFPKRINPH